MSTAWKTTYEEKLVTADEAVASIRAGERVFVGTAAGEPQRLCRP